MGRLTMSNKWEIQEKLKPVVLEQSLDGLLYDLDLMPEQIKYGRDYTLYQAVKIMRARIKELESPIDTIKAKVYDIMGPPQLTESEKTVVNFLYHRLVKEYGENPRCDYMSTFRKLLIRTGALI